MFNLFRKIKPDEEKKEVFRNILLSKFGQSADFKATKAVHFFNPFQSMPKFTASFIAFTLIFSGFSGAAYASQNSLPGETLYGVKLLTEKTKVALTQDEINRAVLYLELAQKRLSELEELSGENASQDPVLVSKVLRHYKEHLSKSEEALNLNTSHPKSEELAVIISEESAQNQGAIANLSNKLDKSLNHALLEAYEETEGVNDDTNLFLFAAAYKTKDKKEVRDTSATTTEDIMATSTTEAATTSAVTIYTKKEHDEDEDEYEEDEEKVNSYKLVERSEHRIISVEHKISEVQRYIDKKSSKYDVTEAEKALQIAIETLQEAKNSQEDGNYYSAYRAALLAYNQAKMAKKLAEKGNKMDNNRAERDDEEDEEEYEYNFRIAPKILEKPMRKKKEEEDSKEEDSNSSSEQNFIFEEMTNTSSITTQSVSATSTSDDFSTHEKEDRDDDLKEIDEDKKDEDEKEDFERDEREDKKESNRKDDDERKNVLRKSWDRVFGDAR